MTAEPEDWRSIGGVGNGNHNRNYVFPVRSSFKIFCISNSHPPSKHPTIHFLIPHLDSIMFSVLLDHGSAARCKGNGKHGKAPPSVEASCPSGAMDSKGGRNRGQKAVVAAANRYSRHGSNLRRSTTAMVRQLRQLQRSTKKRASRRGQKAPLRKMIKKDGNVLKPLRTTAERKRKYESESHHGATSCHAKLCAVKLRYGSHTR